MRKHLCIMLAVLLCLPAGLAAAELSLAPQAAMWDMSQPLEITLSASVDTHMPFDDDRLAQLTALLGHVQLRMNVQSLGDEEWSRIAVLVDGTEASTMAQRKTADLTEVQLSALPGNAYALPAGTEDGLSALLGNASTPIELTA